MKYELVIQFFGGRGQSAGGEGGEGGSAGGIILSSNNTARYHDIARNERFNSKAVDTFTKETGINVTKSLISNVEPRSFQRILDSAKQFMKENPDVTFTDIKPTNTPGAFASTNGTVLNVNPRYFYDQDTVKTVYDITVQRGFHPKNTTSDDIAWHEYGHMLVNKAIWNDKSVTDKIKAWNGVSYVNTIVKNAYMSINNGKYSRSGLKEAKKGISGYATKNSHETIAEAYADYHRNGNRANKFSIAIIEELKKKL